MLLCVKRKWLMYVISRSILDYYYRVWLYIIIPGYVPYFRAFVACIRWGVVIVIYGLKGHSEITGWQASPIFIKSEICAYLHIRIVCVNLNLKGILHPSPRSTTIRLWLPIFEKKSPVIFFKLIIIANRRNVRNSLYTTPSKFSFIAAVILCV